MSGYRMCVVHRLWVHGQNIRWVVAGAHKWSDKARTGARGCNRLGVMSHVLQYDNQDSSDGMGVGDVGIGRTGVGQVKASVYES